MALEKKRAISLLWSNSTKNMSSFETASVAIKLFRYLYRCVVTPTRPGTQQWQSPMAPSNGTTSPLHQSWPPPLPPNHSTLQWHQQRPLSWSRRSMKEQPQMSVDVLNSCAWPLWPYCIPTAKQPISNIIPSMTMLSPHSHIADHAVSPLSHRPPP